MKIFAFDLNTKRRGHDVLGERSRCSGHGSGYAIPGARTEDWIVLDSPTAVDGQDKPITAEQYGQPAICFCLGEMRCGTDVTWSWVVVVAKGN